eukprot:1158067-Pelagomonas_calceolata.AAC.16
MSRAFWRADVKREGLQRVYGITFPDTKQLKEYQHRIEEVGLMPPHCKHVVCSLAGLSVTLMCVSVRAWIQEDMLHWTCANYRVEAQNWLIQTTCRFEKQWRHAVIKKASITT